MTFIKNSITNSFATLMLGMLFFVVISLVATTTTVHAADDWGDYGSSYNDYGSYTDGWGDYGSSYNDDWTTTGDWTTGGDLCTNCSDGWGDYGSSYNDYNTYTDGWGDWGSSYNDDWTTTGDWGSASNNGWYEGGDVCTNCATDNWGDWGSSYNDYTINQPTYSNNDYQYPNNDYQYQTNDYQYDYPGVIYDDWDNNDWNLDLSFDYYDYDRPQQTVRYPTYTPSYTPSSSYYNNVVSNVTNTNTNINTNTNTNINSGYPVYIPQAQPQPIVRYSYPTTIVTAPQPQPRVTVAAARTSYVHINQVPYTGTNDLMYIAALIVAAFGVGAVLFFHKTGVFGSIELPAFAVRGTDESILYADDSTEDDSEKEEDTTLSLENGEDGPKLSFFKQR